jgi:hypothetical protein
MNGTLIDSISLYDDGNHGDQQLKEGKLGNYIPPLESEDIFIIDAKLTTWMRMSLIIFKMLSDSPPSVRSS